MINKIVKGVLIGCWKKWLFRLWFYSYNYKKYNFNCDYRRYVVYGIIILKFSNLKYLRLFLIIYCIKYCLKVLN